MQYRWTEAVGLADWVLKEIHEGHENDKEIVTSKPAQGFIMKSGPTSYTAWVPNDAGNRMEFFDVETAKAWVFTQVRMDDGNALLRTDSLR
jgi:hypothetical protein